MKTFDFRGFEFRVIERDGDPWFVAKDVCDVLGIGLPANSLRHLDDDEKGMSSVRTPGGDQQVSVINEPGLYSLILRSRKERAREFKRWVTHEVLPTIRQTENYVSPGSDLASMLASGDTEAALALIKQTWEIAETERSKRLESEPRTLSAYGAEARKGGQAVWDLRDRIADMFGVDTKQVYKCLQLVGAVEKRTGGSYLVKPSWSDILFNDEHETNGKVYNNGAPRVRPGKQGEFLDRITQAYASRFGIN